MKKLLLFVCISVSLGAMAQYRVQPTGIISPKEPLKISPQQLKASTCTDTLLYAYNKGKSFPAIRLNNVSSARGVGQYFEGDVGTTVTGFTFYAYADSTKAMPLVCRLYSAKPDSSPNILLYQDTFWCPPSGGFSILNNRQRLFFDSAVTVNSDYIVAIINNSASDVNAYFNNYSALEGKGEFRASCLFSSWVRGQNVNIGASNLDADFIAEPHVTYKAIASFSVDTICSNGVRPIWFVNNSKLISSPAYNAERFTSGIKNGDWDFGDGTPMVYNNSDTTHKYAATGDYNVILYDTLKGWYGNVCGDVDTNTVKDDYPIPGFKSKLINKLVYFTDTSIGAYAWFWRFGDGDSSMIQHPWHIYPAINNTYLVQQFVTGACGTMVSAQNITLTGIEENTVLENVKIYPSPANRKLNVIIDEPKDYKIRIYDVLGKQHYFEQPKNKITTVTTADWPAGHYIVRIEGIYSTATVKIEVVH